MFVLVMICLGVLILAFICAIDENTMLNKESMLTENAHVISKNVETISGVYPVTTYNGYGYTTKYVNTVNTTYTVTFALETEQTRLTFNVSKKQYEALEIGNLGCLSYQLKRFKGFEKLV